MTAPSAGQRQEKPLLAGDAGAVTVTGRAEVGVVGVTGLGRPVAVVVVGREAGVEAVLPLPDGYSLRVCPG